MAALLDPASTRSDADSLRPRLAAWLAGAGDPPLAAALAQVASELAASAAEPSQLGLSVVSPVYRAADLVAEFVAELVPVASSLTPDFEIVLVDDGSPDESWLAILAASAIDPRVRGIRLSRNFGQHVAITAGLDAARGRRVAVMDCDLQDDPRFLRELWQAAAAGNEIVYTRKTARRHGWLKNLAARGWMRLHNALTGQADYDPAVGAYSLLGPRAVAAFRTVRDVHRHYLMVLRWLGFPATAVPIQHRPRPRGQSSYGPLALVRHAVAGLTASSDRPLYLALGLGGAFLLLALAGIAYVLVSYWLHGFREGWASTIVLILMSTSAILLAVGAVGVYVGKIFEQVKPRPLYLVAEDTGIDPERPQASRQSPRSPA
jgi:dolichol-phosphate mannosyltransferase